MNWKKSTTYTVLKKLCEKGIFQNENTIVSSLIKKDEFLRYTPVMYQGGCTYTFSLFSPEKGGKEKVFRTETIAFDINGIGALNAREMVGFADEVNALLKKSTLLLSSNEGSWSLGPSSSEPFFEVYSWLDDPGLYDLGIYKKGDSLETKLLGSVQREGNTGRHGKRHRQIQRLQRL